MGGEGIGEALLEASIVYYRLNLICVLYPFTIQGTILLDISCPDVTRTAGIGQ